MPIFGSKFYSGSGPTALGVEEYRVALRAALATCDDADGLLREEVVAITRTITDGVREVIKKDRHIRRLVLDLAALPLASWAASLDKRSTGSLEGLKRRIAEMERDLERGKIGGFPASMVLHGKPTFTTFAGFYETVFSSERSRQQG